MRLWRILTNPMAHTKQARKSQRQTEKRTIRNAAARGEIKALVRKVRKAILAKDKTAIETIKQVIKKADKATQKNILKMNTAARVKSRLMLSYNKMMKQS